jgi:hypothetical protein
MEVSGQLHAPAAFPLGKRPRYPLDKRLGGPLNRSGRRGQEKIFDPTGLEIRPLGRPASRYTGSLFNEYEVEVTVSELK